VKFLSSALEYFAYNVVEMKGELLTCCPANLACLKLLCCLLNQIDPFAGLAGIVEKIESW
jgi:hypothetical protein